MKRALLVAVCMLLAGCGALGTGSPRVGVTKRPGTVRVRIGGFAPPGNPTPGDILNSTTGSWSGAPVGFSYQWKDCNSSGGSCVNASGTPANLPRYVIVSGDVNSTLEVAVTATYAGGQTATQTSAPTLVVNAGSLLSCNLNATTANFTTQVTAAAAGQTICLASGTYTAWTGTSKSAPGITITAAQGAAVTMGLGDFALGSVQNFTVNGTGGGGTFTVPVGSYLWQGSTTTARNITVKNVVFAPSADLTIDGPTNANILLDHDSWNNSDCLTQQGIRIHLSYSNNTQSGVTLQNSLVNGGSADGIQIGDPMTIQNNLFENIFEGSETQCHTDAIQLVGTQGVATVIKGNWIINTADGIGGFDGPLFTDIENNVFDSSTENNETDLDADVNSTIIHNVYRNPANGVGLDLTSKMLQGPSTGETIKDNIFQNAALSLTGGGCSCTATPAVNLDNMFSSGATGSNFNGTPTYVGGTTFTSHDNYLLTVGSAGHHAADDGTDVGTASVGALSYGPQ